VIRRLPKIILPFAVLGAAVVIAGIFIATKPELAREPVTERTWVVAAEAVAFEDIRPMLHLFGEVIAGREVDLRALVAGSVVEIGPNFIEGGNVRRDELLVAIDPFDYHAAYDEWTAQRKEAEARLAEVAARLESEIQALAHDRDQLELIRRDAVRKAELFGRGTVSQKIVDDAQLALSRQRQLVNTRETSVRTEQARRDQQVAVRDRMDVGVRRAARDLERVRLTAPFDGFLARTGAAVGKRLGANDLVATLIAADRLEVKLHLSDDQYGRILEAEGTLAGRTATVAWQVGSRTMTFPSVVDRLSARIDTASGGVDLYALIDGAGLESPLRPGAFVAIELPDRLYRDVVRLPGSAVHGGERVYVVRDGRLEERAVEVAARYGDDMLVRGDIVAGERVVTTRFAEIGPGLKVEVR
jgi:RND family efflux transporter MFP subunit